MKVSKQIISEVNAREIKTGGRSGLPYLEIIDKMIGGEGNANRRQGSKVI